MYSADVKGGGYETSGDPNKSKRKLDFISLHECSLG